MSRTRQVSDLTPLAGLSALRELNVSEHAGQRPCAAGRPVCPATLYAEARWSPILRRWLACRLQTLDVSETQVSDLSAAGWPVALQTLDVSDTQVTDLAPLAGLSALQTLIVSETQVSDLAPLAGLSALRTFMSRRRRSPTSPR